MTRLLADAWTVAAKDLRCELRERQVLNAAISFALTVLLMFSFTFDPNTNTGVRSLSGGLLWVVYLFAGVLVLNRSFARETANDSLAALVASPLSGEALFLGKTISSCALILAVELISLPVFGIFFDVTWFPKAVPLMGVLVLGSWSFAAVGTTFGAVTASNRLRELMLPLLLFPTCLPALVACMSVTWGIFDPAAVTEIGPWVRLLVGFDIIYTLLGVLVMDALLTAG